MFLFIVQKDTGFLEYIKQISGFLVLRLYFLFYLQTITYNTNCRQIALYAEIITFSSHFKITNQCNYYTTYYADNSPFAKI